jgi:hypothetical protein
MALFWQKPVRVKLILTGVFMKKSAALFLSAFMMVGVAHAGSRVQFECYANGISGKILISTEVSKAATVQIGNQAVAVTAKDNSAMNMSMINYDSADKRVSITLVSRGNRWDGSIKVDGEEHGMSCDYK